MADGSLLFKTALDDSGLVKGLGNVKKVAVNAFGVSAKAVTAVTGAMTAGLAALTTSSVKAYADYEQLVGGVETLFKSSEGIVLNYANNAYKTAGLSANAYMETVTSFSASLLQSLGGDTEEAAKKADKAITDMSDNANKMGTSMQSIQDAYQGFAKQNYTMLDNLKLGYGGTKEEMQRLLDDATKLSGVKFDISSYADIVDAIHVVQDNLDITGTTAKEASTTIQGSIAAMGAAWTNFMTGMADPDQDFDALLNNLVESVVTVADNLVPRLVGTVPRLVDGLSQVATKLSGYLPEITQSVLPALLAGASSLSESFVAALPEILSVMLELAPDLVEIGIGLIGALAQGIVDSLPQILDASAKIADEILKGIVDLCPALAPITDAIQLIRENMDTLIPIVVSLTAAFVAWKSAIAIVNLVNAFTKATKAMTLAQIASNAAQKLLNATMLANPFVLIATLVAGLVAAFIYFWNTSEEFRQFWIGLWESIKAVASAVIDGIVGFFTETIPNAISAFKDFVVNNWQALLMLLNPVTMLAGIFKLVYDNCEVFRSFVDGFVQDIKNFFVNAWNAVVAFFTVTVPQLPETVMYCLGYLLGSIIKWGLDLISWAQTNIPIFIDNVVTFFAELPGKIWAWLLAVINNIGIWAGDMAAKATAAGTQFLSIMISFFAQLPGRVWTWLKNVIGNVTLFVADMAGKATAAGKGFFDNIVNALLDLPSKMAEIGGNIVSGIWQGISDGWKWLLDSVKNLATSLFNGAKDALDIHSPSKKFKWLGEMCVEGMDEPLADYNPYDTLKKTMTYGSFPADLKVHTSGIASMVQGVKNTAENVRSGMSGIVGNAQDKFDYDLMGQAMKGAVNGIPLMMDGKVVGKIVAPYVDTEIGRLNERRT